MSHAKATIEPETAAVQVLLSLSDVLAVTRQQRHHALWMFADLLLPTITHGRAKQTASADSDMPFSLFAVACLLLAVQNPATTSKADKEALKRVYTIACSALGDSFSAAHSSSRLLEAAAIVQQEIKATKQLLTSDYLLEMHSKIEEAGLATCKLMALDTCYMVLELLYSSPDYRRSQPLECGGKLLAAAILASTFVITVEPAKVSTLPFLSWLSDLSRHPKEIIKAQTEQVLACCLQ